MLVGEIEMLQQNPTWERDLSFTQGNKILWGFAKGSFFLIALFFMVACDNTPAQPTQPEDSALATDIFSNYPKYREKYIQITGDFISKKGNRVDLGAYFSGEPFWYLTAYLDPKEIEKISELSGGETITLTGFVKGRKPDPDNSVKRDIPEVFQCRIISTNSSKKEAEAKKNEAELTAFNALSAVEHIAKAKEMMNKNEWSGALRHIQALADNHPNKKPLLAEYERRQQILKDESNKQDRINFANILEKRYLDNGMDVSVSVKGPQSTTLVIKYILVNRVTAHQMSNDPEIFVPLKKLKFKRLEITDGYDSSWYWTFD